MEHQILNIISQVTPRTSTTHTQTCSWPCNTHLRVLGVFRWGQITLCPQKELGSRIRHRTVRKMSFCEHFLSSETAKWNIIKHNNGGFVCYWIAEEWTKVSVLHPWRHVEICRSDSAIQDFLFNSFNTVANIVSLAGNRLCPSSLNCLFMRFRNEVH